MKLQRLLSLSLAVFVCVGFVLATDRRAYGYVDPGQGLMLLQTLGAALAAFAYFLRRRIRALFGGDKQREPLAVPAVEKEGAPRKAA